MASIRLSRLMVAPVIAVMFFVGGCATLEVTPRQSLKPAAAKVPVKIGIETSGDRIRALLDNPDESIVVAASSMMFDKVVLLPGKARFQQPTEIFTEHGVDYILQVQIADLQANGRLNPIFFPSILLFFFKPLTPMVTYESSIVLSSALIDARTGAVLYQKEIVETATDHYSPVDPQEKVKKLIALSIHNALVKIFSDLPGAIAAKKK